MNNVTLADVQLTVRDKLNELRALDRVVNSIEFMQCLRLEPNNPKMVQAIETCNLELLRDWMQEVIQRELCELGIRQLRSLAGQLGITSCTVYNKDELLILIVQKKYELSKVKNDVSRMPHSTNGTQAILG